MASSNDPAAGEDARGVAVLRAALVPLALLGDASASPGLSSRWFPWVIVVFGGYAAAALALAFARRGGHRVARVQAALDLVFAALLVATTGGPRSPLKYTFYVLPVGAALRLSPRLTATWVALAVVAYLVVTVNHPETTLPGDLDGLAEDSLSLLWVGGAAVMLSALTGRRQAALAALAANRRALVRQALDAEARERRRLAEELHDHAIQNVLLARQEIADVARGVPGADERARHALDETSRQLRQEVFEMHPLGLERVGLSAVLGEVVDRAGRRARLRTEVAIAPAAERCDAQDLVVSVARELVANVVKHAHAGRLALAVDADAAGVRMTVADDGVGLDPERLDEAVARGHIGVASVAERVRAVGGTFAVDSAPGSGTTVSVTIPRTPPGPA